MRSMTRVLFEWTLSKHVYACTQSRKCASVCVYMCVCAYVCVCVYVVAPQRVCVRVCVSVYAYIFIFICTPMKKSSSQSV